ncbi:MAG: CBS domain-containing protein, partial [Candidatus Dadabacteria bacterium]
GKRVQDIMSSPAITVHPYTSVREIAIILDKKRIKRVPVVDDDGRLIGIVSRADIVRIVCEEQGSEGTEKDTQG